jgi:hypothetical protein
MRLQTYTERLELLHQLDFASEPNPATERGAELLRWSVTRLLLGENISMGRTWFDEQRKKSRTSERHLIEFLRRASLAAAGALFETDSLPEAEAALSLLPDVLQESMFDEDAALVLQTATALALFTGDSEAATAWRERRFAQPVHEGWEASAFELLYLTHPQVSAEGLDSLAMATTRVAVETLFDRFQNTVAPLILALSARCREAGRSVPELLNGKAHALDEEVFDGRTPRLRIRPAIFKIYRDEQLNAVLQALVPVEGTGAISTGAYELAPLTTKLTAKLVKLTHWKKKAALVAEALFEENSFLEGCLKLEPEVSISEVERQNVERRMLVAVKWAAHLIGEIKCRVSLSVRQNS